MGRDSFKISFFLFIFFIPLAQLKASSSPWSKAWEKAKNQELYKGKAWLNLGHYKKSLWHGHKSESLEDSPFFLSKDGRFSPKKELKSTIRSFLKEGSNKKKLCQFPARLIYLKKKLPHEFKQLNPDCLEFTKFKEKLNAKSLSLVFSSYYLNAPASAFGHTLLRFIKNPDAKKGKSYELLDYAANYAALVTTDNSLLYGIMGLLGGFQGEFASMPYFYKIREYNDFESRDIWDYELNLDQDQLDKLIAHLWEMKLVHFPYYYLTHNCSYHMLSLLDVANDKWELTDKLRSFVIPVDTVKALTQTPGLLKKVRFRPSKQRVLKASLERHNEEDIGLIKKSIKQQDPSILKKQSPLKTAQLIDSTLEAIDFLYAEDVIKEDLELLNWKRKFLLARSRVPIRTQTPEIPTPQEERPDLSHSSRRLTLARGEHENTKGFTSLELRLALHDLIDPPQGQAPGSSLEMGKFRIRYNEDHNSKLQLENFTLAEVHSLSLNSPLSKNFSWSFFAGGTTLKDENAYAKFSPEFSGYGGYSFGATNLYFSTLLHAGLQQHKDLSKSSFRIKMGPRLQLIYHASWGMQTLVFSQADFYTLTKKNNEHIFWGIKLKQSLGKRVTINAGLNDYKTGIEGSLGLSLYY